MLTRPGRAEGGRRDYMVDVRCECPSRIITLTNNGKFKPERIFPEEGRARGPSAFIGVHRRLKSFFFPGRQEKQNRR